MKKHGLVFIFLTAAGTYYAWSAPLLPIRLLLASGALCFFLVGFAFLKSRPGVLLKRPDGTMPLAGLLLFWPYHLLNGFSLLGVRLLSRENPEDEIVPGLFLGRRPTRLDREQLAASRYAAVLDLTSEFPERRELAQGPAYLCIPLLDTFAPTPAQLADGIRFIREHHGRGPVLVHCALGHGRSATFVAGYLLSEGLAASPEEALERVRARRPGVRLSAAQRAVLEATVSRRMTPDAGEAIDARDREAGS